MRASTKGRRKGAAIARITGIGTSVNSAPTTMPRRTIVQGSEIAICTNAITGRRLKADTARRIRGTTTTIETIAMIETISTIKIVRKVAIGDGDATGICMVSLAVHMIYARQL